METYTMNAVIENALNLSTEEKTALYYQLQESLGLGDNQLSELQMQALEARELAIAKGDIAMLSRNEFSDFLKERRNALHTK